MLLRYNNSRDNILLSIIPASWHVELPGVIEYLRSYAFVFMFISNVILTNLVGYLLSESVTVSKRIIPKLCYDG